MGDEEKHGWNLHEDCDEKHMWNLRLDLLN